ncbi:uncharacterized protein EDB91DRAFT_1160234 [Suillus paluster]|uniref:uncharacterized protein n=1 Tax=Suillus paluster TaxID=48578 RepID=UPI001B85F109|nr:uncharacterized protein EDB91DRAFT_1160234 [Suillus paluster]KAG1729099.1 hypothetical protein EDB91DRAFT_1160234 [Suillus paluster]
MSFPAPESLTPAEFQGILEYLRILLQNLPTAFPVGSAFTSKYLAFLSFTIDAELLDRTGSEIGALNEQFKQIFGWQTRTTGSGIVAIEERGEPICAVVDVLEDFHVRYPTDNVIKKWAVDIGIGVQEVYSQHNIELPPQSTATKQQKQTLLDSVLSISNKLNDPISLLVQEIGAAGVVDEFRCQLQAYFHNEWPFNAPLQDGNTLAWWNTLLPHPHARVLAALAVKFFSVLINSMPDERTGSKLTWLNSAIRANQNAQTLVDMIQIGQWYGNKAEKSRPRKEPYRPTVKFRDIDKDLLRAVTTGVKPATNDMTPPAVDTGHDSDDSEDLLDDVEDGLVGTRRDDEVPEDDFLQVDEDIHLGSPLLRDLISTVPVVGSQNVRVAQDRVPVSNKRAANWNF